MATPDNKYLLALLHDAKLGESDAFAAIYTATIDDQYRKAWSLLHDVYLTQDALQDTYVHVFRSMSEIQSPYDFHTMLSNRLRSSAEKLLQSKQPTAPDRSRRATPEMEKEISEQLMELILEDCRIALNVTPLETLMAYNEYRHHRYILERLIILIVLAALAAMPILYIKPHFQLSSYEAETAYNPSYLVNVETPFPAVTSVVATIDNQVMPVTQTGKRTYSIAPITNGEMKVKVNLATNQSATDSIEVVQVDKLAPTVDASVYRDHTVYLTVSDNFSGVDYDAITLMDTDGQTYTPSSIDPETGTVGFALDLTTATLHLPDRAGNAFNAVMSLHASESAPDAEVTDN